MATVEVSRTLVKSPPELWEELQGERLREALGAGKITPTEDERLIVWEGEDSRGTATLEPSGWGTKVTLRAEVDKRVNTIEEQVQEIEQQVAKIGLWARIRGVRWQPAWQPPPEPAPEPAPESEPEPEPEHPPEDLAQTLEQLLDDLGSAHKRPFQAE